MTPQAVDAHWLDFYALLGVPTTASEEAIRKRIGKVYSEAAANSDHRDLARRHYFQALIEHVLPQCRRVLLDPEWRAKYDRQHILNANGDPQGQNYVAFIASMRSKNRASSEEGDQSLPLRLQEDMNLAREVVECAWQGAQLELLPTQSVSSRNAEPETEMLLNHSETLRPTAILPLRRAHDEQKGSPVEPAVIAPAVIAPAVATTAKIIAVAPPVSGPQKTEKSPVETAALAVDSARTAPVAPIAAWTQAPTPQVEEIVQSGEAVRAQVITGQEAAALRRERAGLSGRDLPIGSGLATTRARGKEQSGPTSRIVVGDETSAPARALSSTSLNLMVAIVGVILTITVQHFSGTPAVASNAGRTPIFVAVAPEMEKALARAELAWEQTPEGARFDLVVQPTASRAGLSRALGAGERLPDAWIPSDASWVELYNRRAPALKRQTIGSEEPLAQSPMVLMARRERAAELRRLFPAHQITSWQALQGAIARGAAGHLGLSDPQKTESGALARVSMAREWGAGRGLSPAAAAKNPGFWRWMSGFEDNAPSASARTAAMVKDMAQGTTGRFWWVVAYESDALQWMQAGKALEIFYLPRTTYANHPFCTLERVGAGNDVAAGRASFEKYLRSAPAQKALLSDGFRPTEINLKTKIEGNPFLSATFRARGARLEGLPLEERANTSATEIVAQEWGKRFG